MTGGRIRRYLGVWALVLAAPSVSVAFGQDVGVCPNYTIDSVTGEPVCRVNVRPGETIFYWNTVPQKSKHTFVITINGKLTRFAVFNRMHPDGRLHVQAWTSDDSVDDYIDAARDDNGDGFFENFCKYEGGTCRPITLCYASVDEFHRQALDFYNRARTTNDPVLVSYAFEKYARADKFLKFCRYLALQRGPIDERQNQTR